MVNLSYQRDEEVPTRSDHRQDTALTAYTTQDALGNAEEPPGEGRGGAAGQTNTLEHQEPGGTSGEAIETEAPGGHNRWTVALGAAILMAVVNMAAPCFSLVFSSLLLDLGESSTTIGWLFNSLMLAMNVTGLFAGNVLAEFGWMKVAMTGTILSSCAFVVSAFATSAWFLFFSSTLLGGIGLGLINSLCFMVIPYYFASHRGVANACMLGGICLGLMLGSVLIGVLHEEFGSFGATIVFGAIILHGCVGASFLCTVKAPVQANALTQATDGPAAQEPRTCNIGRDNVLVRVCRDSVRNLAFLRSPRASIIAVGHALTINSFLNFVGLVPFLLQAAGHPSQTANLCVTMAALGVLVVSLVVSSLTDWPWFNMQVCCAISNATVGASALAFSLVGDIRWQLVFSTLLGSGHGGYMAVFNLVAPHYMGRENMAAVMGATFLAIGLCFTIIGPITGVIRDASGSYAASMWFLAGLSFASFASWLFMGPAIRYDRRRSDHGRPAGDP